MKFRRVYASVIALGFTALPLIGCAVDSADDAEASPVEEADMHAAASEEEVAQTSSAQTSGCSQREIDRASAWCRNPKLKNSCQKGHSEGIHWCHRVHEHGKKGYTLWYFCACN